MAGEVYSPLKLLYIYLGPVETVYSLGDFQDRLKEIMSIHEKSSYS
jgi:hypothetical protein